MEGKLVDTSVVWPVPRAGKIMGLGRYASYEAAKRGDLPVIKIGRRLFVPLRPFEKMLGLDPGTLSKDDNDANGHDARWHAP